ncbi:MAG: threonine synthase [bacterium]|nr:threonine synthase [bacterium]
MLYGSTRGGGKPKGFTEILLEGLAPDGGLFVPRVPRLTPVEFTGMRRVFYPELATTVLWRFADDITYKDLRAMVARTYTAEVFRSDDITPVRTLEPGLHILGLSHGPTLSFKDIAMQLQGNLFEYALGKSGRTLNVLGATSGDTGSAAEYAMRGKKGIRVFILSPLGKMSPFQTAQMFSRLDDNIFNIAIRGVFDECQDIVKAISNDIPFKEHYKIGTVNSINWARIIAQVVYYFKAYFAVTKSDLEYVDFVVPTGNFGDACAGFIARMMGLPVRRLIVATNENNVLDEFFRTGVYRPRATSQVVHTSSPSMDISKASNFERYVYYLTEQDGEKVKALWKQLDARGFFDLFGTEYFDRVRGSGVVSDMSTHQDRLETIRRVYRDYGQIIDPHTADGVKVGLEYREKGVPMICLETALPAKFEATIMEALGRKPECPKGYEGLESLPQRAVVMDPDPEAVKRFIAANAQ